MLIMVARVWAGMLLQDRLHFQAVVNAVLKLRSHKRHGLYLLADDYVSQERIFSVELPSKL
jgi:hypothetical protein